jgi:hypothetical protein
MLAWPVKIHTAKIAILGVDAGSGTGGGPAAP